MIKRKPNLAYTYKELKRVNYHLCHNTKLSKLRRVIGCMYVRMYIYLCMHVSSSYKVSPERTTSFHWFSACPWAPPVTEITLLQPHKRSLPQEVPQQPKQYTHSTLGVVAVPLCHTVTSRSRTGLQTWQETQLLGSDTGNLRLKVVKVVEEAQRSEGAGVGVSMVAGR